MSNDSESGPDVDTAVQSLTRLTTLTLLPVGTPLGMVVLDWVSDLPIPDGIVEVTMTWDMMPILSFVLLGVGFYVALETSLHVENDDAS